MNIHTIKVKSLATEEDRLLSSKEFVENYPDYKNWDCEYLETSDDGGYPLMVVKTYDAPFALIKFDYSGE